MKTRNQPLTPEEFEQLIEAAYEIDRRYGFTVYVIGHTGMRPSAMAHFSPDWLDTSRNLITIPESQNGWQSKIGQKQHISLPDRVVDSIAQECSTLDLDVYDGSSTTIRKHVSAAAENADLDPVTPHHLRRLFATEL